MTTIPTTLTLDQYVAMRDALISNRAKGVKSVAYEGGKRVDFRDDAEMASAIDFVTVQIRALQSAPRRTSGFASFGRGH